VPPRPRPLPLIVITEEVATTAPLALVERTEFGMERVRAEVEAPAVKVWRPPQEFAVVVEKAVEKTPVEGLYESGYEADKEDEEILLLKVVQSVEARKPLPVLLACASESVLLESENGPENESELMAPTPLPMRMPEGVEEPVPPLPTPKVPKMLFVRENVEVAETVPFADACRNPAPVESVRAEVEAPALKVCSWEKPLAALS